MTYDEMLVRFVDTVANQLLLKTDRKLDNVFMLSGGVDSLMVLACFDRLFGAKGLKTVTIKGVGVEEVHYAQIFSTYYETDHTQIQVCTEDLMEYLPIIKGCGYTTVFQAMFHILMQISVDRVCVCNRNLIHGGGADALQSSQSPFLFAATNQIMLEYNVIKEEAQNILRRRDFEKQTSKDPRKAAAIRKRIYTAAGANIVDPFNNFRVYDWFRELDTSIIKPKTKGFMKDALTRVLGIPGIKVQRKDLQTGTGLYYHFRSELEGTLGHSVVRGVVNANNIIKEYSR